MIKILTVAVTILAILIAARIAMAAVRYERGFGDVLHLDLFWVIGCLVLAIATAALLVSQKVI